MSSPPSLLSIPFEVRAMIIALVAQAPQSAPPDPGDLHGQRRRTPDKTTTDAWQQARREHRRVVFPAHPAANPALPLLLANRQLHAETLDTLRRAAFTATGPPSYKVDIIYLKDDCTLWPTWISVPARAAHVDTVHAQFRIFKCPEGLRPEPPPRGLFPPGVGLPTPVFCPFYHLLVRSMQSGSHAPCGRPFTVNRLVLDFLPATETDILPLGPVVNYRWTGSYPKETQEVVVSDCFRLPAPLKARCRYDPRIEAAALLMCFVLEYLEYLARLNGDVFERGKRLFENIGVIELRLDGKRYKTLDLGRCLAKVTVESWGGQQWLATFLPWKSMVEARRRELNIPV